jgi:hypothetical protein
MLVILVSLVGTLASPIPKHLLPPLPFFPTKVGNEWVYTVSYPDRSVVTTETIEKIEEVRGVKCVHFAVSHDHDAKGKKWRESVSRVMEVRNDGLYHVDPWPEVGESDIRLLKLPHVAGDKWEEHHRGMGLKRTCTAFRAEKTKVPAGEFEAVRVETYYAVEGEKEYHFCDEWYARGVGLVKRHTRKIDRIQVLKSFTPGK